MPWRDAVRTCLSKYADFTGTASRSEFWSFAAIALLATWTAEALDSVWVGEFNFAGPLQGLVMLLLLSPMAAAATRRLREAGHSPALLAWLLLPVIGWGLVIVSLAAPPAAPAAVVRDGEEGLPAPPRARSLRDVGLMLCAGAGALVIVPVLADSLLGGSGGGDGLSVTWGGLLALVLIPIGCLLGFMGLALIMIDAIARKR